MPRSLKVVINCDSCGQVVEDGDAASEGMSPILTVDNQGPRQLDFCESCYLGVTIHQLMTIFNQADDLPKQATTRPPSLRGAGQGRPSPCPACDHIAGSPQALGRHAREEHHSTVAELRESRADIDG